MKGSLIKQVDSRIVAVEVSECEPLPVRRPYSMHDTGRLLPLRVDIRWESGKLVRLSVVGAKLKKDGTVGFADGTTHFVWYGNEVQAMSSWPEWLADVVAQFDPNAS